MVRLTAESDRAHRDDATRTDLLAAAAEVFAERGYDGAGVAEIARRAGLTTGAIYSRYTGKAQLLLDAIEASAPGEIRDLLAGAGPIDDPVAILTALGGRLVEDTTMSSGLLIEVFAAARRDPEVAASLRALFDTEDRRLAELVQAGQGAGVFAADLPVDAVVRFCTALGLGMHVAKALGLGVPEPERWAVVLDRVIAAATASAPQASDHPTSEPEREHQ